MIPVTPEVQALLLAGSIWYADLFTITLLTGQVIRYTSADIDVTWDGHTWVSCILDGQPIIERGDITFSVGLSVDQLELTIYHAPGMLLAGLPIPHAIRAGLLDGAEIRLDRAVAPLRGVDLSAHATGIIPRFAGKVGPCTPGRIASKITVDSLLAYLRAPVPRNVYQPSCANTLYDNACGLDRAAAEVMATVDSVSADGLTVTVSGVTLVDGVGLGGFARWVSGSSIGNTAQQVTVADNVGNELTLLYPFPAGLAVGDQIALAPGCAKTLAACSAYGNLPRFRGQPHVPVPETML